MPPAPGDVEALPVAVGERAARVTGPADLDGVAGGRPGAAVRGGREQVVPAVAAQHVRALELVVDSDGRGRADRAQPVRGQLGDRDAAVVAAVVEPVAAVGAGELAGVDRPQVTAAGARSRRDHWCVGERPRPGRARRGGHTDRGVERVVGDACVGDRHVHHPPAGHPPHVRRPERGAGSGVGGPLVRGERVAGVGPVDQVGGAGDRHAMRAALALAQRVGGAEGVPESVVAAHHDRVGEGVGEPGGDRVAVAVGPGGGRGGRAGEQKREYGGERATAAEVSHRACPRG